MSSESSDLPPRLTTWFMALFPQDGTYEALAAASGASAASAYLWLFGSYLLQFLVLFWLEDRNIRLLMSVLDLVSAPLSSGAYFLLAIGGSLAAALASLVIFVASTAIVQWAATLFGGRGSYSKLAYALGMIMTPSALISTLFSLIAAFPLLGYCIGLVLTLIAGFVFRNVFLLQLRALKDLNHIGWGAAFAALAVLLVIAAVLAIATALATWPQLQAIGAALLRPIPYGQ